MKKILLLILALITGAASAEPIKLKNSEANELLNSLAQIGPGLTAQNTTRTARNINSLRPVIDAFVKGDQAAQERLKIKVDTKRDSPEGLAYLAEQKKNNDDEVTIDLQRITLTDEEITASKITPAVLSTVLRYLELKPAPPK